MTTMYFLYTDGSKSENAVEENIPWKSIYPQYAQYTQLSFEQFY